MNTSVISLILGITALAASCSPQQINEPPPPIEPVEPFLNIETSSHEVVWPGDTLTILFSASASPLISVNEPKWCVVELDSLKAHVDKNNFRLTVKIGSNHSADPRSAEVTLAVNDTLKRVISFVQSAWPVDRDALTAMQFSATMGLGWNLGNQMDAHVDERADETCWGNPKAKPALFVALARLGVKTVRIPVTWMGHIGDAPDYKIEQAWLNRVYELVECAESAGLNVIVNIHHDGADSAHWLNIKKAAIDESVNAQIVSQIKSLWRQIAERFIDKGQFLVFEGFNEIHDGGWGWGDNRTDGGKQYRTLNGWNQAFVDAVRSTGGENWQRILSVPCYCTNPSLALESTFELPKDPIANRMMVAVHFYDPYEFSLNAKFSEWGHTAASDKKETWGDESNVTDTFAKLRKKFIDHDIPVYLGEMGCVHRSDERGEAFRKYYLEYVTKAATDDKIPVIYWDNGSKGAGRECSGLIDRATGECFNNGADIFAILSRAAYTQTPDYTLQSVYKSAP